MQCGICSKEMPGAAKSPLGVTICGSCVLAPIPDPPEEDSEGNPGSDYDLSFLDDHRKAAKKAKRLSAIQMSVTSVPLQEVHVKKLRLKSNSIRSRLAPVGTLMLSFDSEGVTEFPEAQLPVVEQHMRLRPGRFRLLDEVQKAPESVGEVLAVARELLEASKVDAVVVPQEFLEAPRVAVVPKKRAPAKKKQPVRKKQPKKRTSEE